MKLLIVSQVYWPDMAATSQILTDLAEAMAARGHEVVVVSGRRRYDAPAEVFPAADERRGVDIRRLPMTGFGKASVFGRLCDFASFNLRLLWRLVWTPGRSHDAVLGMTSPPMVSFLAVMVACWKQWRFCYWAMDLQPELAIQAGMIKPGSLAARTLDAMGRAVFRRADTIVALDRFMADYIRQRGAAAGAVCVRRLWPVAEGTWAGARLDNPFRRAQGFGDRVIVMYSGNHAVVHPLDTLLEAARRLRDDPRFLFVFIGGGTRVDDVTQFREAHGLAGILQLPYQPRSEIHLSLSAADLHVVVLGDGQVGFTHPNKVYGAMALGRPFVYIGPTPSHITDLIDQCPGNLSVRHGEVEALVAQLTAFADAGPARWEDAGRVNAAWAAQHLGVAESIGAMAEVVEAAAALNKPAVTEAALNGPKVTARGNTPGTGSTNPSKP